MTSAESVSSEPAKGRLFRKYVRLFVTVVAVALLTSGAIEGWFTYRQSRDALLQLQHEQAQTAAAKISGFIQEIVGQLRWTTQLPWFGDTIQQRRLDAFRLLHLIPAITEVSQLDPAGREQLRVSRLAMDVIGSNKDFSGTQIFEEAVKKGAYYGPVYFRRGSEPYISIAVSGSQKSGGVSVAEVNLKLIWDLVSRMKVGKAGHAFIVDAAGRYPIPCYLARSFYESLYGDAFVE